MVGHGSFRHPRRQSSSVFCPSTGFRPGLQRAEVREGELVDGRGCRVGGSGAVYKPHSRLTLFFWIADPESGQANVRSDVNVTILRLLNARGVEIPFPQRVVHQRPQAR
jgi:hypothetical protein